MPSHCTPEKNCPIGGGGGGGRGQQSTGKVISHTSAFRPFHDFPTQQWTNASQHSTKDESAQSEQRGSRSFLTKRMRKTKLRCCLLVGCLTSQQHASVSQGQISSDNSTCCHSEIELVADQIKLSTSPTHSILTLG